MSEEKRVAPLLHVDQLVKRFAGLVATDHVQLEVRPGEVHALIGPNGAGKTTLIHQISGGLRSDEGRIRFDGVDVTAQPVQRRVRAGLARSYQITSVFKGFTVLDNLALAVQACDGQGMSFWRAARTERARYEQAAAVGERVGLSHRLNRLAGALSHGEQRQLEVGLALATRPRLLLLDEPKAGMGPDESQRMLALLQSLRTDTTILLVEHDMHAVFQLADRISALVLGRVIACGTPAEIREHPAVQKAYLGDDAEEAA